MVQMVSSVLRDAGSPNTGSHDKFHMRKVDGMPCDTSLEYRRAAMRSGFPRVSTFLTCRQSPVPE